MAKHTAAKKHGAGEQGVDPLEFALDFEVKSTNLYLKLAALAENPLGKKLFYSLAAEEIEHARRADDIYFHLKSRKGWRSLSMKKVPTVASVMKDFFLNGGMKEAGLRKKQDDFTGYRIAMEMEKRGYHAYLDFYSRAKNETEREFFREMLKEEKEHLDALANVYSYLTNTEDWLQENESKVWNWMSL